MHHYLKTIFLNLQLFNIHFDDNYSFSFHSIFQYKCITDFIIISNITGIHFFIKPLTIIYILHINCCIIISSAMLNLCTITKMMSVVIDLWEYNYLIYRIILSLLIFH